MTDNVSLLRDGTVLRQGVRAQVDAFNECVSTFDASLPLQVGDLFSRRLPSGVTEYYEIISLEFCQGKGGSGATCRSKIRRAEKPREAEALAVPVFLVHGRDEAAKHSVARCLERLVDRVIVLHEQANMGRTIIEKFEDNADSAAYAVVLLTPDDVGGLAGTPADKQRGRARQNVIFELGFFSAKLGRGQVCALLADGVETPSDYSGVAYVKFDVSGAWKLDLAKELAAAGFSIDLKNV